jgi:hypothetical protein
MKKLVQLLALCCLFLNVSCGNDNDTQTLTSDKVIKKISEGKSLLIKDKTIKGFLDFTKVQKTDNKLPVAAVYIESEIIFAGCTFEDSVAAFFNAGNMVRTVFNKNVVFYDCKFLKGAEFTQAEFAKDFSFELSNVEGKASFDGTDFSKGAVFASANFQDDCTFINSRFHGKTTFFKSLFKKAAIFQHIKFYEPASFWDSNFYGYFEFSDNRTFDAPDFMNAKFSDRVVFCNSVFTDGIKLKGCKFLKPEAVEQKNNKVFQTAEINDIFNQ